MAEIGKAKIKFWHMELVGRGGRSVNAPATASGRMALQVFVTARFNEL